VIVSIYDGTWPFVRRRILNRVSDVQRSFEFMGYGKFLFEMPATDTPPNPDELVGIVSKRMPAFLGWVDRVEKSQGGAYITVSGREWAAILDERTTQQAHTFASGTGGSVAGDVLRRASARNFTGFRIIDGTGSPLTGPFTVRADSVLSALTDLSDLTGDEWLIKYTADDHATATFYWGASMRDKRHLIHLVGKQIARADYVIDGITDAAIVQVVGSDGEFSLRPSAVATDGPLALQDIASVRVPLGTQTRRSIGTSRELAVVDASLPDALGTQRRAVEDVTAVLAGQESISVTCSPYAPWEELGLGDTVTVHVAGEVRPFQILGMQPREDLGLVELVGRVRA